MEVQPRSPPGTTVNALSLFFFGSFRIERDRQPIHLPRRKVEALLTYLVLHPQPHPREKLAALLWGDFSDVHARASLRNALAVLRKELGEGLLLTEHDIIQINPNYPLWVDAHEFGSQPDPQSAIALYRGDLLTDFYDDWILPLREHYRALYLDALLKLTQEYRTQSEYAHAIEIAQKILKSDPANERAHQHLMFCYMASGDRQAALEQYGKAERALQTELAVEPAPETKALYLWIKQTHSEVPSLAARITNLPIPLTSFIGRRQETREVKELLAHSRLLTLKGAGGSGKTRLAIQVTTDLIDQFKGGVWWIELAGLMDEMLVPQAVAKTLGVREVPNTNLSETLINYLRSKRLLLVLDNCEHLIGACAQLSNNLLTQCPNLQILATSREPLNISGETVWFVPTLSVPEKEKLSLIDLLQYFESIRLFVERAKAVKSDFVLTDQNATSIARICLHLDGMPLAIELAAARIKILSPEEIAAHLDNRFELLIQGSRTAMPRHQTLRAAINWSYDLLSEEERVLFRRLSVFAGGFTLEAAEAVCAGEGIKQNQILELLSHLVDKSLVGVETKNGTSRYRILETIREYAREMLLESREGETIHRSHLVFMTRWVEQVEPELHGPQQIHWLDQIETEHDNLRVALQWATANEVETGLRLAGSLGWFWFVRGYPSEGVEWLNGLIVYETPQTEAQVTALGRKALLSSLTGDFESAVKLTETVLKHRNVGNPRDIAWALRGKAIFTGWSGENTQSAITWAEESIAFSQAVGDKWHYGMARFTLGDIYLHGAKDYAMAERIHKKSLEVLRRIGDKFGIAHVLLSLGLNHLRQGNYPRATELEVEALVLLRELGDKAGIAWTLANLSNLARWQGDYERARLLAEEKLALWRDVGFGVQVAWSIYDLGRIATLQNSLDSAASHFKESLNFFQEKGSLKDRSLCLVGPAHLAVARGKFEHATRLCGAIQNLSESNHIELEPGDRAEVERNLAELHAELDETRFEAAWVEGQRMTIEHAIEYALSIID